MLFPELTKPELVKLDQCVKECVDSLTREEGEKVLRKDICERVQDEFAVKKALFNKLVAERFLERSHEQIAKLEELVEFNESLLLAAKASKTTTSLPEETEDGE